MPAITLTFPNLDRFLAGLRAARQATPTEIRTAMDAATLLLEGEARNLAPRDEARLQGSISSRITGSGLNLTGEVGPSVRYGLYVERGTGPAVGRAPYWPPHAPLARWATRHGIPVFLVQRAIFRRGTRAQPFIGPALDRTRGKIEAIFAQVGARIFARVQS